jgi:hypothetical protein
MLKYFVIDGVEVPLEDVFHGKVATMYPLPYLRMAADERVWDGKPHVTDLFAGIRELWLKKNRDYGIDPDDAAFRAVGTGTHERLEAHTGAFDDKEIALEVDEIQGRSDLKTMINGEIALVDYKVVGSYKVAKALGIYQEDEAVLDENGKAVLFKTGKNAGQPKTKKVTKVDPAKADMTDYIRQLNIYRVLWKKIFGEDIQNLYIFAILRDGKTMIATSRGLHKQTYTIRVPVANDEKVWAYINKRSQALCDAMAGTDVPPLCSNEENWDGRKCQGYCPVAKHCQALGDNPFLGTESEGASEE